MAFLTIFFMEKSKCFKDMCLSKSLLPCEFGDFKFGPKTPFPSSFPRTPTRSQEEKLLVSRNLCAFSSLFSEPASAFMPRFGNKFNAPAFELMVFWELSLVMLLMKGFFPK